MAKKETKSNLTTDDLGRMMQGEFAEIHSKFDKVYEVLKIHTDQFGLIRADIRDIKTTLGPLVQVAGRQEHEMRHLKLRVRHIEQKVGIASPAED